MTGKDEYGKVVSKVRAGVPMQKQRQDSLVEQARDLHAIAVYLGMYDAADFLLAHLGRQVTDAT